MGIGCPYPHPGATIPGAALRARECARTEVALPEFRSPGRYLLSTDVQIVFRGDPRLPRSLFPALVLSCPPPSRSSYSGTPEPGLLGFPPSVPTTPSSGPPER